MTAVRTRDELESYLGKRGVNNAQCWGRTGQDAVEFIEQGLGFALPEELRAFAFSIGNVHIGCSSVIITGNRASDTEYSCVTETASFRKCFPEANPRHIIIGHNFDQPLFWEDGVIREYEPWVVYEGGQLAQYSSLEEAIEAMIEGYVQASAWSTQE